MYIPRVCKGLEVLESQNFACGRFCESALDSSVYRQSADRASFRALERKPQARNPQPAEQDLKIQELVPSTSGKSATLQWLFDNSHVQLLLNLQEMMPSQVLALYPLFQVALGGLSLVKSCSLSYSFWAGGLDQECGCH